MSKRSREDDDNTIDLPLPPKRSRGQEVKESKGSGGQHFERMFVELKTELMTVNAKLEAVTTVRPISECHQVVEVCPPPPPPQIKNNHRNT